MCDSNFYGIFKNCIYLLQVKSFRVIVVLLLEVMFTLSLYLLRCFQKSYLRICLSYFFFLLIQTIKQKIFNFMFCRCKHFEFVFMPFI